MNQQMPDQEIRFPGSQLRALTAWSEKSAAETNGLTFGSPFDPFIKVMEAVWREVEACWRSHGWLGFVRRKPGFLMFQLPEGKT